MRRFRLLNLAVLCGLAAATPGGGCAQAQIAAPPPVSVDPDTHHLGDNTMKNLHPAEAEGGALTRSFTLANPGAGRWGVAGAVRDVVSPYSRDFRRGEYHDTLRINGKAIARLNDFVENEDNRQRDLVIPIPDGVLKAGANILEVVAGGNTSKDKPNLDDFEVARIRIIPLCRIRVTVQDAQGHAPLPAKITAQGIRGTEPPRFGPAYRAAAAGATVFTAGGTADLMVPRGGVYRLTVSRGPEYTAAQCDVEASGPEAVYAVELRRCLDTAGYVACDFHLHAEPSSDSQVPLEDRVTCCAAEGLEFIVSTDHNAQTDYTPAIRAAGLEERLTSAVGDEITTRSPEIGHFNAWPLPYKADAPRGGAMDASGLNPRTLVERLNAHAGIDRILQINHPRDGGIGYFDIFHMDRKTGASADPHFHVDFQAIEVFNGSSGMDTLDTVLKDWYGLMNRGRFIAATGTSDSHKCVVQDAGYARTWVRVPDDSAPARVKTEDVMAAVKAGRAVVSSGPFIRVTAGGKDVVGELLLAKGSPVALEVQVQAAPWVGVQQARLVGNGKTVAKFTIPAGEGIVRWTHRFDLRPERDTWYVILVEGDAYAKPAVTNPYIRPFAFTGPIRLDADGDGKFTAPEEAR